MERPINADSSQGDPLDQSGIPQRKTPVNAAELASIQRNDKASLCHGLDMTTKARAVVFHAEEMELSIHDLICVGYAVLRNAESGLDALIKKQGGEGPGRCDFEGLYFWSVATGGLTSVRMTLRAMLETPTDPGLWKTCAPWGHTATQKVADSKSSLEQRLLDLQQLKAKNVVTDEEYRQLRCKIIDSV